MTPLQNFIEEANKIDSKADLFSKEDLKSFTDLLDTQEEFNELLKWFNSPDTVTEINKIWWIQETIKTYVVTQKGLEDLTSVLSWPYTVWMENQELYEVCTLGAILTGKVSAKAYYESMDEFGNEIITETDIGKLPLEKWAEKKVYDIGDYRFFGNGRVANGVEKSIWDWTDIIEKNDTNDWRQRKKTEKKVETLSEDNFGTRYETGDANTTAELILNSNTVSVKETTTLDDNKKITGATVTIAAGADTRTEDIAKGKEVYNTKKEDLKNLANSFTWNNKKQINEIFFELYGENIQGEQATSKFEIKNKIDADTPQEGNYYLIGARVAEWFIDVLNTLTLKDPEPTLTLDIDWSNCVIGKSTKKGDIVDDRFLSVYLEIKKEDIVAGDKKQSQKEATIEGDGWIVTYNPKPWEEKKGQEKKKEQKKQPGWKPSADPDLGNDYEDDDENNNKDVVVPTPSGKIETKTVSEKPIDNVESAEIISLKKELAEHFTINGKAISREIDISNSIVFKDNIYTVAIQWYTWLQFAYDIKSKKIEVKANTGGIRKWLFLYDVTNQSVATDKADKLNIVPKFNSTKTIETINKQLESNDQDSNKKADYKVKSITGTKMEFEYGVDFVQDNTDTKKTKTDTFTLDVDATNNIILPDSQEAGQVSQRKKSEGQIKQDSDFIFDNQYKTESGKKIFYYAKTKANDTGSTELTIMNNIQKTVPGWYESIYTDHKEMTNPEFKEIKKDFLTNKIERIFAGTLHEGHQTDFQNNRKITKDGKGQYNFEITFNKNNGKQQHINIPFTATNMGTNTRNYIFSTPSIEANIDNVIYDINTSPIVDGVPSIKMIENKERTLENAGKNTSKKIVSDIFSEKTKAEKLRGSDNNKYEVQPPKFSLGTIEFDGKGGYKRTILFGEQKDVNGNTLLHGEEKGTIYFDQDYKIIHINILKNGTEEELDFGNTETKVNMENVLEDDDANQKWVILAPTIVTETGKPSSLQLKFDTPAPKETNKNRQNADLYLNRIREEKETIFNGLKTLSSTIIKDADTFKLPNLSTTDEASYPQKIMGPDGKGLYQRRIAEAEAEGKYLEQNIYCKVEGKSLVLCDSDGKKIDSIYLTDYKNKEYYELKIDATKPESFSVKKLEEVDKKKLISLKTEDITYQNTQVSINVNDNTIDLLQSNLTNSFTFSSNKHEMCTIHLDDEKNLDDEQSLKSGENKPQIIEPNNELFGSYKKYFAGEGRESLWIAENEYEDAFKKIYDEYQDKDTNKKIIQVKLRSNTDNKYYYEYMAVKQNGTKFSLEKLDGLEKAKEEMKKRLDNLVALDKMQASTKWDILRGVKINTKNNTSRIAYLKDKNSPVKITLSDTAGETTAPIEITMKDYQDRLLNNNVEVELWNQKVNCTKLKFEDGIPLLKIELVTQTQ